MGRRPVPDIVTTIAWRGEKRARSGMDGAVEAEAETGAGKGAGSTPR